MTVREMWEELAVGPGQEGGWNARRVATCSDTALLIALRKPDNVPALLVEVPATAVPAIAEYPTAEGFDVLPEIVTPGLRGRVRLCLTLASDRYRDVFEVLVDDVVTDLRNRQDDGDMVRGFLARLNAWQAFMRRHGPSALELEAQIGLMAELLFLRDHALGQLAPLTAVTAWVGPLGGAQDFVFPEVAIEVKASTAANVDEVRISSLEQLDAQRSQRRLLLCWMDITTGVEPNGVNLPRIVLELRNILKGKDSAALRAFEERLFEVGYLDAHERYYQGRLFRLRGMRFYKVSGAFPRIERRDVRQGVASCTYVIGLSGCNAFKIEAIEANRLIRGEP